MIEAVLKSPQAKRRFETFSRFGIIILVGALLSDIITGWGLLKLILFLAGLLQVSLLGLPLPVLLIRGSTFSGKNVFKKSQEKGLLSRFRTKDSLYFVGPINEEEPQVILRVQ